MSSEPPTGVRIQLLGGFRISAGDHFAGEEQFRLRRARSLLKLLALAPNHRLHREQVIEQLWADQEPEQAANNFHQVLYTARKILTSCGLPGQEILQLSEEVLSLCPQANPWIDVEAFEAAAFRARQGREPAGYQEALVLYSGDLLPADLYEDWTVERREALRKERLDLLLELARLEETRQENDPALAAFQQIVTLDPLCEEAHAGLMRLYALGGQRSAALAQYETCRRLLEKELGVEPSAETTALVERIRAGEVRGTPKAAAPATRFSEPPHRVELPVWLSPFVGRADVLAEIRRLLEDPACRLLTLAGPGGTGKTRLAAETAARLEDVFPDGVCFVPLAPLESALSIPAAILTSMGLSFQGAGDPRRQVLDYLRERTLLLVLDNFEHLLEGVSFVLEILLTAPRVRVLVTSRVRLDAQAETVLPIAGMSYPGELPESEEEALRFSGVQLFLGSARRANPGFKPGFAELVEIVRICRQVEGLPLAILLAASWARLLSPAEIGAEIAAHSLDFLEVRSQDVPERQRSLRTVFDHSWALLSPRARQLFAGLCVFRGGFNLAAAQQVCGAALRELAELVDCSMLERAPEGRYEIHELLRQYGEEKLADDAGDGDPRDRHAAFYIAALRRWELEIKSPRQLQALAEMEQEIGNIQAAWKWAAARRQVEWLAEGMLGLGNFYRILSRFGEGPRTFAQAALALTAGALTGREAGVLAGLMTWQGYFELRLGHTAAVKEPLLEIQSLLADAEQAGQDIRHYRALSLYVSGTFHQDTGDLETAKADMLASLQGFRELGLTWEMIRPLYHLAEVAQVNENYQEATRFGREGLALARRVRVPLETFLLQTRLAFDLSAAGQFNEAERLLQEYDEQSRSLGPVRRVIELILWAKNRVESGKLDQAIAYAEEAADICLRAGIQANLPNAYYYSGSAQAALGRYEPARAALLKSQPIFEKMGNLWGIGAAKHQLGLIAMLEGQWDEAQRLLAQSVADQRRSGNVGGLIRALADLSILERKMGRVAAAQACLVEVLRIGVRSDGIGPTRYFLPAAAFDASYNDPERALELQALASRFPFVANTARFAWVGALVVEAARALPPEVVAAAQRRGEQRELGQTMRELLAGFEAEAGPV